MQKQPGTLAWRNYSRETDSELNHPLSCISDHWCRISKNFRRIKIIKRGTMFMLNYSRNSKADVFLNIMITLS
jgi:hypothetical protein